MLNYKDVIEALKALTPEEMMRVGQLIRYDQSVPELILSLEIEQQFEENAAKNGWRF